MKIAFLSGKGGTGKTFVSTNLASLDEDLVYMDFDVEEPNGNLFFKADLKEEENVEVKIPYILNDICFSCQKCVKACKFGALGFANNEVLVFEELCHSCLACRYVCPRSAVKLKNKVIGKISKYKKNNQEIYEGSLNIKEESGTPIIEALLNKIKNKKKDILIDCPPGSSCLVIDSIKDADYCVLVAEESIFGAQNLKMVYELAKKLNKKIGVVLNKFQSDIENPSLIFCKENNIKILGKIPFDLELAKKISNGELIANSNLKYKEIFKNILQNIKDEAI